MFHLQRMIKKDNERLPFRPCNIFINQEYETEGYLCLSRRNLSDLGMNVGRRRIK
jgi:hypothetical protein